MSYEERLAAATGIYQAGLRRVANTPYPATQKFPPGTRVRVADDLGPSMSHFPKGIDATVECTYAHAYGGGKEEAKMYSLILDGRGTSAWYYEHQLTEIVS